MLRMVFLSYDYGMETIAIDPAIDHTSLSTAAIRLLAGCLLGMVIGLDREIRSSTAGLRTHMLVALAASLFGLIAFELVATFGADSAVTQLDPTRLVEAVTTGVAFLGAGAIIHARGQVRGLTTGAGMWMAGAVGLACGIGYIGVAALATALALVILLPLRYVEARLLNSKEEPEIDVGEEESRSSR